MRPLLPSILLLVILALPASLTPGAALAPGPLEAPTVSEPTGSNLTIILDANITLLSPRVTPGSVVVLESKTLLVRTCYPCEETRLLVFTRPDMDGCYIGSEPRDESKVCIEARNGAQQSLPLAETDDLGEAVLAWGDGCVIHHRDGLPPQKVAVEGIAVPATSVKIGASCDA